MLGIGRRGPLGRAEEEGSGGPPRLAEQDAWIALNAVEGVGPVSFGRLVAAFGSAAEVLVAARAGDARLRLADATRGADGDRPLLSPAGVAGLMEAARDPAPLVRDVRRTGVGVVTLADASYPSRLRRVELPPPVLFLRGDPSAMDRPEAVAIVGTRRPTGVGRSMAGLIGEAVGGLGATIVSGLAVGIDAAAHEAALRVGTPTVAVIGGGHDHLYPASHHGLAREITSRGGAVVSEFAPSTIPTKGTFPRRNRLISGLSSATIVVEAGARSGALTTAAWALEQGRGLYLVPGRPGDPAVAGCLAFLREAGPEAHVVAGIPELLVDLGLVAAARRQREDATPRPARRISLAAALATLGPAERAVAMEIAAGRGDVDLMAAATGLPAAAVLATLTALEVRGMALEAFGRYLATGALAQHRAPAERGRGVRPEAA